MFSKRKRDIVRTSRKGYIPYYFMAVIVGLSLLFIKLYNYYIHPYAFWSAIAFIVLVIKVTEVHRLSHHYELTDHGLEKAEGWLWKKHKRLGYGSISQVHLSRTPWDIILGIGTVEIAQFSETVRTEIKNINKPKEFVKGIFKHQRKVEHGMRGD